MSLPILDERPWYADGLAFTCTQCGNCCTGGPGVVWVSDLEVRRLARHLKRSTTDVIDRYCRRVDGRFSLIEHRNAHGEYDCVFLHQDEGGRRTCTIYPVRPLQCRTWPFWGENLASEKVWNHSGRRCPGINHGKKWSLERIHEMRDATDWPPAPPSSI